MNLEIIIITAVIWGVESISDASEAAVRERGCVSGKTSAFNGEN